VDTRSYSRAFGPPDAPGWLRVGPWPGVRNARSHALKLELHGGQPALLLDIVSRLRRMFDLDADPRAIAATLRTDARLGPLLGGRPGLRIPGGWDGFEIAVRAVLGQQVSVAAARTICARLAQRHGPALPDGLAAH